MNDLKKWEEFLNSYKITYDLEEYDINDPWAKYHFGDFMEEKSYGIILEAKNHNKVDGYSNFQARILFNDKKEFQKIDIYE